MAYGTEAAFQTYASDRGYTLEQTPAVLLTLAHDYIESLDYLGAKTIPTQDDQWPRVGVKIDGVYLSSVTVPQDIIDAEYQVALAIDQGNSPVATITPAVKSESVDTISVEYQNGAGNNSYDPMINRKLRKYLANTGNVSGNTVNVSRA